MGIIILILVLILLLNPKVLPGLGSWLGGRSRKPYRQARWVWSSLSGTEDEAIRAEFEYGRECARAFAGQFSGSASPGDQELAAGIGARLASAVKDPRRRFRFNVAVSPVANAFALPGGFVFITDSLLELCGRNRDETAFFLGHEIGHVLRGHAKDHLMANTFLNAVSSRLPAAGRMLREVIGKGYARTLEFEADEEAVRLAAAAGFDPRASLSALKRLEQAAPGPSGLAEYLSSHPSMKERIGRISLSLRAFEAGLEGSKTQS